jgi:hypothetical protein
MESRRSESCDRVEVARSLMTVIVCLQEPIVALGAMTRVSLLH